MSTVIVFVSGVAVGAIFRDTLLKGWNKAKGAYRAAAKSLES